MKIDSHTERFLVFFNIIVTGLSQIYDIIFFNIDLKLNYGLLGNILVRYFVTYLIFKYIFYIFVRLKVNSEVN